jgi:phospholipid/cholesterol/gamma-HCH transport system permease protein
MNDRTANPAARWLAPALIPVEKLGEACVNAIELAGGVSRLLAEVIGWCFRSLILREVRFGYAALAQQIERIGIRSIGIIVLASAAIGLILVLQMAPPLQDFDQVDKVANVNAIAVLRELGPLISAIVLTGFAGAAIAAELGTMVVGEEIEALRAMALNPVRFLVVPRVLATLIGLVALTVLADVVAISAGALIGVFILDVPFGVYKYNTLDQATVADFMTGVVKGGVFGGLIGLIACHNGLNVSGGAAGVGRATTKTVVYSIVSIVLADLLFTSLFYALDWN